MHTHGGLFSCAFCNHVSWTHVQQVFIRGNPERSRLRYHPTISVLCVILPGTSENSSFYKNFLAWGFPNNIGKRKLSVKQAQVHGRFFYLVFQAANTNAQDTAENKCIIRNLFHFYPWWIKCPLSYPFLKPHIHPKWFLQ